MPIITVLKNCCCRRSQVVLKTRQDAETLLRRILRRAPAPGAAGKLSYDMI